MQSLQNLLDTRCGTNGRNPEDGKDWTILTIVQQVLRVALLFPVLEKRILLSSSEGAWDRVRKGLVPFEAGGRPDKGFFRTASEFNSWMSKSWANLLSNQTYVRSPSTGIGGVLGRFSLKLQQGGIGWRM